MSSWTSAASEKPKLVHWPFIKLMQRIFKHTVFPNAVSWKFIEVIYQMSNMQVKAIVLSLVTVVWKPQLNATVELQITVENTCSSPTISLYFYSRMQNRGSQSKPVKFMSVALVLNKPHPGQAMCLVPFWKTLGKDNFRACRDSLYTEVMSFIRQITTV